MSRSMARWVVGRFAATETGKRRPRSSRPRLEVMERRQLLSITIEVRYDHDANNFFDTREKRDLMQQVADGIGAALDDRLAAIEPTAGKTWRAGFPDPATGETRWVDNLSVPADTIIIYAGGRPLSGATAGKGGAGSYHVSSSNQAWIDLVAGRGRGGAIGPGRTQLGLWGGAITFDNSSTNWYFGTDQSEIIVNQVDFVSVATHELGHVLGIGDTTAGSPWSRYITPEGFVGPESQAVNGGEIVALQAPYGGHWGEGVASDGGQPVMVPVAAPNRNAFTSLDYAGLRDIGWTVVEPSRFQFVGDAHQVEPGEDSVAITVKRVGPTDRAASVDYFTIDDAPLWAPWPPSLGYGDGVAARAGVDYQAAAGALVFAPGETTKTFHIPILRVDPDGPSGRFRVVLSAPNALETIGHNSIMTVEIPPTPKPERAPSVATPTTPPDSWADSWTIIGVATSETRSDAGAAHGLIPNRPGPNARPVLPRRAAPIQPPARPQPQPRPRPQAPRAQPLQPRPTPKREPIAPLGARPKTPARRMPPPKIGFPNPPRFPLPRA